MDMPSVLGLGLGLYGGVVLPLVGWAIRTHFTLATLGKRIDMLETWRAKKDETDQQLANVLQDLRLEVARLGALQGSMNDSIHRIESRLEAIDR